MKSVVGYLPNSDQGVGGAGAGSVVAGGAAGGATVEVGVIST